VTDETGRLARAPRILWRDVGAEILLADPDREDFELLSETGASAWRFLETPRTPAELIRSLAGRYGAAPEAIQMDVASLLEDLTSRGTVVRDGDHGQ
jgi:hypothetical protein